ncbi:GntR family transcriptional regulator (plasmid) [Microvirga sp. VF16]|nr:GntR family transcriptional regulator [Microvirga sp. VF16]
MDELTELRPHWRRIEMALLQEIDAGALPVGQKLPGENILARQFGVTRTTLRRALNELQAKGVLRIERGRGTFVTRHFRYDLGRRSSFMANLREASLAPSAQILTRFTIAAPSDVAERLDIPAGDAILVFDTVGKANDVILSMTRHHLPARHFPEANIHVAHFVGITEVYEMYGHRDSWRSYCEIEARLPTLDEAHRLEQSKTDPVLEIRSVKRANDVPIDYTVARFAAGRVTAFFNN